ncbi:conjugal transfer relaxase TraA [Afipia felis]|uniref:Conjugal transfer relaxase TraA n=3 Tax=Afipia felis TaxID=1035 RepID=A0A380WAL3_AFIFE|nr:conjugative relaxase domain-containing protein [Afipia felis ATCC 53690]SUU77118.1 conjugal transfer relaxase TraA [Afipia felis]SUU85185.1 conjugal transfer relaxase TraA [Afipia felis]
MVTRPNKVFSATYFTQELESARYFLADSNLSAFWLTGDARFGVQAGAALNPTHFERLFEGRDESGQSLLLQNTGLRKRISAYELSVGVSKSVSAAWALASPQDRAAIEQAFCKSLNAVSDHVCRNSFTRLGHNGKVFTPVQPNIACFIQPDTRPVLQADGAVAIQPQLHAHLILPNLVAIQPHELTLSERNRAPHAQGDTGKIPLRYLTRSLDGQPLYHGAKSWGAIQHLACATELQKLGYCIGDIGPNGTFEIVPPSHERDADERLRHFWSARRKEIENELSEAGLTTAESPELAARAAVKTRRAKVATSEDTFARWRREAETLGVNVERYTEYRRELEMPSPTLHDSAIAIRMADIPRRLTEFEATFDHHDLIREVASALIGTGVEVSRVDEEIAKLSESGAIVEIGRTERERIFSTQEMIHLEREVVEASGRLAIKPWHPIDRARLVDFCLSANLSDEQTAAVLGVANRRSIDFIEGRAGTGKTTTLQPLCRALEKNFRIIATGVSWRTARMLEDELSGPDPRSHVEARALDSWLALDKAGGHFCDGRTLLLVDESSQIGVRAMHNLLTEVERSGACALFLGDRAQTLAVSAGSGIELVARTVEAAEISKVVRQSDPQLRLVVEQLARGDVVTALETMADRDCIIEADGQAATVKTAVDNLFARRAATPEKSHLLICKSNAMRLALDSEVRRRLRAEGLLTGEDVRIDAVTPSGRAYRLSLAKGDRIRFGIRCDISDHRVINGTIGKISDIVAEEDGHALIAADVDGHELLFSSREVVDDRGRIRLATDYASTIWSSQGLTSHSATIVTDAAFDRRDIYVALSRAKQQSTLCVDSRALNFAIRAETGFDRSAEDITVEERREHLVRQMSRWRTKTSTLDFVSDRSALESKEHLRDGRAATSRRARGLQAEAEAGL